MPGSCRDGFDLLLGERGREQLPFSFLLKGRSGSDLPRQERAFISDLDSIFPLSWGSMSISQSMRSRGWRLYPIHLIVLHLAFANLVYILFIVKSLY